MKWTQVKKGGKKPKIYEDVLLCNVEHEWMCSGYWNGRRWFNQFEQPPHDADVMPTHWMQYPTYPKTQQP